MQSLVSSASYVKEVDQKPKPVPRQTSAYQLADTSSSTSMSNRKLTAKPSKATREPRKSGGKSIKHSYSTICPSTSVHNRNSKSKCEKSDDMLEECLTTNRFQSDGALSCRNFSKVKTPNYGRQSQSPLPTLTSKMVRQASQKQRSSVAKLLVSDTKQTTFRNSAADLTETSDVDYSTGCNKNPTNTSSYHLNPARYSDNEYDNIDTSADTTTNSFINPKCSQNIRSQTYQNYNSNNNNCQDGPEGRKLSSEQHNGHQCEFNTKRRRTASILLKQKLLTPAFAHYDPARNWVSRIHIHGITEIFEARSIPARVAWILLFAFSTLGFGFEAWSTVHEYIAEPIASQVTFKVPEFFPEILYCPGEFADHQKASRYNMSRNVFAYVMSLFPLISREVQAILVGQNLTNPVEDKERLGEIYYKEFVEFANRNGFTTIDSLIQATAKDSSFIVSMRSHMFDHQPKVELMSTIVDVCYRMNRSSGSLDQLEVTLGEMAFEVIQTEPVFKPHRHHDRLYLGQETMFPVGEISIKPGHEYIILLNALWKHKMATTKRHCRYWSVQDYDSCLLNCFNELGCKRCYLYVPGTIYSKLNGSIAQCTAFSMRSHCMYGNNDFKESSSSCHTRCYEPCQQWFFGATVIPDGLHVPSIHQPIHQVRSGITFRYANPLISLSITEFPTYTLETLLCNLGGVASLFFGASLLSFIQILGLSCYFLANKEANAS